MKCKCSGKLRKAVTVLAFIALAVAAAVVPWIALEKDIPAKALTADDLAFSVSLGIYDNGSWQDVADGTVVDTRLSFKFEFNKNNENISTVNLQYISGVSSAQVESGSTAWSSIGTLEGNLVKLDDGVYVWTYPGNDYDMYIKFRAYINEFGAGGATQTVYSSISRIIHAVCTGQVAVGDIEITALKAEYLNGSTWLDYNTNQSDERNIWVSTQIRFTLTTKNMASGGSLAEKFFYSFDGKNWTPMPGNQCVLAGRNINGAIQFKVMDAREVLSHVLAQINSQDIWVKMDTVIPEFSVSAVTSKVDNSGGIPTTTTVDYQQGEWSAYSITFRLLPVKTGESMVTYSYKPSTSSEWRTMTVANIGGETYYIALFSATTRNIEFKATNAAGTSFTATSRYDALIDTVQPIVHITATDMPKNIVKNPISKIYSFTDANPEADGRIGYASDMINFVIYNRNASGVIITNASELVYQYCYSLGTDSRNNPVFSEYSTLQRNVDAQGGVSYSISDNTLVARRIFKFRLISQAGLSDEKTFEVAVINSEFSISVDPIIRSESASGWAFDRIPVDINVPIAELYTFLYTISGDEYLNFSYGVTWAADGSGSGVSDVQNVTSMYANLPETDPKYFNTSTHMKFRIYLSTSVERRKFILYVHNAAGVESNRVETVELKLDMVSPQVYVSSVIQNSSIELISYKSSLYSSPDDRRLSEAQILASWANGNIVLTLDARSQFLSDSEISLSGITCELMLDRNIPQDELQSATDNFGVPIGKFTYVVEIPENYDAYEKTLIFRLTSGSGLTSYVYYDAKIDKRKINVDRVVYDNRLTDTREDILVAGSTSQYVATTEDVSKDITLTVFSNQDDGIAGTGGHYTVIYSINGGTEVRTTNPVISVSVPGGTQGILIFEFKLESYARNNAGVKEVSVVYTVNIPYNTSAPNLFARSYDHNTISDTQGWKKGAIGFILTRTEDESELFPETGYTFGIVLLGSMTEAEYLASIGLTSDRAYTEIFRYVNIIPSLNSGSFYFYGVNDSGKPVFSQNDVSGDKCFYSGGIAIYAFNSAKYASNAVVFRDSSMIKIDNSTPNILDAVGSINGIIDSNTVYNNESITIKNPGYTNRSQITYYYIDCNENGAALPSDFPTLNEPHGWRRMDDPITVTQAGEYYFYALNELGSGSIDSINNISSYKFVVDSVKNPGFTVDYPEGQGSSDTITDSEGNSINVYAFRWSESATITFGHSSNTPVNYYLSYDYGKNWELFMSAGTDTNERKKAYTFSDNMNITVLFRMVNFAGTVVDATLPAVIRIDKKKPIFTLRAEYANAPYAYNGTVPNIDEAGGYTSLSSVNWNEAGGWAASAITLIIEVAPGDENPSKVDYQYKVVTQATATNFVSVPAKTMIDNKISFTTDRMDNFGENNDAVVIVLATCSANGLTYAQVLRIRVDKVIPEFALKGEISAGDGSNRMVEFKSGDWAGKRADEGEVEVILSLAMATYVSNVSPVTITYSINGSATSQQWTGLYTTKQSETLKVTAKTAAGREYVQYFSINIDIVEPRIISGTITPSETDVPNTYYIDQPITYIEENIKYAQYITRVGADANGGLVGFPLSQGHIIATNSVDNSEESKGYVKIIIEDLAGNKSVLEFYMVPFGLDINNITLSDEDMATLAGYEEDLSNAKGIDDSRRAYFENQIMRLKDRVTTLRQEIAGFQSYLAALAQKTSYELRSDYKEMASYIQTYNDYEFYNQTWIQQEITQGVYADYFEKLLVEFAILEKSMKQVSDIESNTKALPAINVVEVTDYNEVLRVYDAYTDLLPDQKACFTATLYNKLVALKKSCETMLLQDEASGVYIDGNLAPGAKIEVTTYANTVELFNNAQGTLLSTVDAEEPRTVVSIHKVSLTGAASQTATGTITVTLPIPEEYYNYVRFAVYRLSPDGTVSRVSGVTRDGNGMSVTFTANSLDTYILAMKANIEVTPPKAEIYGTVAGIEIDAKMLAYLAAATVGVFFVVILVVVITSVRRKRFLDHYNRQHKKSIYKKGIQQIPKGNNVPRANPYKPGDRVRTKKDPYQ